MDEDRDFLLAIAFFFQKERLWLHLCAFFLILLDFAKSFHKTLFAKLS